MSLLHSVLGAFGLSTAGHMRTRLEAADRRATKLEREAHNARQDVERWKSKAEQLTARLSKAQAARASVPQLERDLKRWKARDEKHVAQLAEVRERMVRAEHATALSQEHLLATETKLDVIEAALGVLDRRTRRSL